MKLENEFALVGVTLIDGDGGPPQKDTTIIVKDGVIHKVGKGRSAIKLNPNIQQLDFSGHFVMPGLIECHIHLSGFKSFDPTDWVSAPKFLKAMRAVAEAQKVLDYGFTTVRGVGSRHDIHLKQAIAEGTIIGPRILASGLAIGRTGGHVDIRRDIYEFPEELVDETIPWAQRCDGVVEIRKAVRKLINQGVDVVKVFVSGGAIWEKDRCEDVHYTMEELTTVVQEARMGRLRVAAHCENLRAIKMAIEAGVDTIEHAHVAEETEVLDEETCRDMVKNNIIVVPTLSTYFIGPWAWSVETFPQSFVDGYKMAIKAGVKFATGSDAFAENDAPYGKYHIGELKLMVDILGLTPMQVIVSATKIGAEALGIEDKVGTVEEGKLADLLIIKENPAEDISVLLNKENVEHIIKEGKLIR